MNNIEHQYKHAGRGRKSADAVIVGASLAGLMTAIALARVGIRVLILERASPDPRTGAAIGLDHHLLRRLARLDQKTATVIASNSRNVVGSTWAALHASLRTAAATDSRIELYENMRVEQIYQDKNSAWAVTADGEIFRGDFLIGADGHRSVVRRVVASEKPDATFAGYLIWLGLVDEAALPASGYLPQDLTIVSRTDHCLLGYPMSGSNGSLIPGTRQLGWAWYDATRNELLRKTGCVVGQVVYHSLAAADIPEATYRELADEAKERWDSPWREAILDCISRRAVTGTPIAEYVPERLISGRIALVGDAAHVPTPMTGMGFAASLDDAEAIAEAFITFENGSSVANALRAYEKKRLAAARNLVQSGQQFSRGFSRKAA